MDTGLFKMHNEGRMRAVYMLAVSNAVFTMGYGMYAYIFPNFLTSVNATSPQVGLVSTLLTVSMALTLLPGGIMSDAGHRRSLVIASWLLPVFAPPFFILATIAGSWLLALPGIVLFGASWIGVAAVQSYTSEAAPSGKRGLSFGILVSSGSLGLIASPIVGGFVVEAYGFVTLFLVAFILYTVSTALVVAIPKLPGDSLVRTDGLSSALGVSSKNITAENLGRAEQRTHVIREEGSSEDRRGVLKRLAPMVAVSCLLMGSVYIGWSYIPLYLQQEYGFSYASVQIMYAISNLSSVLVVNLLGKISDEYSPANKLALMTVPVVSLVMGSWILISTSNRAILPISFVLLGSVGAVFPLIYSTVGELSAGERVGRTYGVIGTFIYVAEAMTPYLGGILYDTLRQLPFMLILVVSPLLLVAILIAHRRTR